MLLLGLAVFVVGAGVVVVALSGSGGGPNSATATTTTTIAQAGTVIVPAGTTPIPATFTIPPGKQAVAVQMPYVAGLAGYAKASDLVNIYATVEKGLIGQTAPPSVKLVLPAVEVLAVTGPGPGSDAGNATYLLALDAAQAEQTIFFSRFESLWMTLVPKGQSPATTPGRSYQNAF
jgi:hypothetical protein